MAGVRLGVFSGYGTVGHGRYVVGQGLVRMFLGDRQVVVRQCYRAMARFSLDRVS